MVCGGLWWFACIVSGFTAYVPNSGGDLSWFAVMCGGFGFFPVVCIAVNMDRKTCGTFSSFRWLSPDIYHINISRNPNEVDVHWDRSAKPK